MEETTDQTIEHILDVPYYRQIDPNSPLGPEWQQRACGFLALKMVLDYYQLQSGQAPIDLKELFDKIYSYGGPVQNGNWLHADFVAAARSYGFHSWRRGWHMGIGGQKTFQAEGADSETIKRIDAQMVREALPTLVETVESGKPVIVSVAKNFGDVSRPHVVVLTGIKRGTVLGQYQGFYFNDPYTSTKKDRKDYYVPFPQFMDSWRGMAIFVEPKDA